MGKTQILSPISSSAICGMIAPIIFAITVLVIGILTPGYDPVTQLISELGIPNLPYAAIFNGIGLILVGILLSSFAYAVYKVFNRGWKVAVGSSMVVIAGLSFIAMGFFHCDQGCVPISLTGHLHLVFGEIAIIAGMLAAFIFSVVMHEEGDWDGYWQYSLLTGILVVVVLPIFLALNGIAGLLERILSGIVFLWTELVAIRIFTRIPWKD